MEIAILKPGAGNTPATVASFPPMNKVKTSKELPPNFEAINKVFHTEGKPIVYTYGDTVYNVQEPLPEHLEVHERIHTLQQLEITPEVWWDSFISDPAFRTEQELLAYGAQYAYAKKNIRNREALYRFLFRIAGDLASESYGNILTHGEAESKIKRATKNYEEAQRLIEN